MRVLLTIAGLACALLQPVTAGAQPDAFLQSVRELAEAGARNGSVRATARAAATARMRAALAEWDRRLETMRAPHVEMGRAYQQRGRLADALRELDAADRGSSDVQLLRALTLEAMGRFPDAGQAFLAAWTLETGSLVKTYYVAQRAAGIDAGSRDSARAQLAAAYPRTLRATPPAAPPFPVLDVIPDGWSPTPVIADRDTREAFALLREGRLDDAVAALERPSAPVTAGSSPREHFDRGQRYEIENRVTDARREYDAAMPGVLAGRSAMWVGLGRLAQVDGDADAALDALRQAVLAAPNDPMVHRELADAYAAQSRRDDAMAELVAALLVAPHDGVAHAAVGGLLRDAGRPADAVAALTRALELVPARYQTRYTLARAYDQLGRPDDAARERALFEKARLESLAQRRRIMATDLDKEEAVRRGQSAPGGAR